MVVLHDEWMVQWVEWCYKHCYCWMMRRLLNGWVDELE